MPDLDGFGVVAELRRKAEFALTPIIALTASACRGTANEQCQQGSRDTLPSPSGCQTCGAKSSVSYDKRPATSCASDRLNRLVTSVGRSDQTEVPAGFQEEGGDSLGTQPDKKINKQGAAETEQGDAIAFRVLRTIGHVE